MPVDFSCACGAHLRAGDAAVGKRIRCPKCGAETDVPKPAPPVEVTAAPPTKRCPQCAEEIQAAAVICRWCKTSLGPAGVRRCSECSTENPAGSPQCTACGAPFFRPRQEPAGPVKDYFVESILSFLFCGGMLAIPALIYSSQVKSKLAAGDHAGAVEASRHAAKWLKIAVGVGCGLMGLVLLLVVVGALAGS